MKLIPNLNLNLNMNLNLNLKSHSRFNLRLRGRRSSWPPRLSRGCCSRTYLSVCPFRQLAPSEARVEFEERTSMEEQSSNYSPAVSGPQWAFEWPPKPPSCLPLTSSSAALLRPPQVGGSELGCVPSLLERPEQAGEASFASLPATSGISLARPLRSLEGERAIH